MDSVLSKLTYKQHPPLLSLHSHHHHHNHRPSLSSISFKTRHQSSLSSFKIKSFSALLSKDSIFITNSSNPKPQIPKPSNPISLLSLLKTPLCIAITATALFFSTFTHRPLLAIAAPTPVETSFETTANEGVSDEEKERTLEEHLVTNPDDVEALKSLMEVKIKKKKILEAVEVINRLIELDPDEYEWPLLRSHMYSYMGESELAKAGFEEILSNDPLRVEAFHGLVMAVSQGDSDGKALNDVRVRIEKAMERCNKEKTNGEVRDFKLLIAQIRVIEGNYNEALKVYQQLVKEEPRDFRPYLCQGIIYTLLRKKDEAEKQFEKYKRLVPKGHPYAQYFDDNMLATKVFSQMAENERSKVGSRG